MIRLLTPEEIERFDARPKLPGDEDLIRSAATIKAACERLAETSCPKCQGLGYLGATRTPECTCPDCNGTGKPWKDWKEALTGLGKKK